MTGVVQKPSVGRVVHFHEVNKPVRAAIIVAVIGQTNVVNLCVFREDGTNYGVTEVDNADPGLIPTTKCWTWPVKG